MSAPKLDALAHYQAQLRAALDDLQRSLSSITPDRDRERNYEIALRAARWEAIHQGPFNWSGEEIK